MSSDEVVLVTRLDLVSLHRARHHVEFIVRHGAPRERIHVVAMGTGLPGELPPKSVTNLLGTPVSCVPSDEGSMTASINVGNPLVLEAPRAPISKAIVAFTEQLSGTRKVCTNSAKHSHPIFGMAAVMFG
jgi:pilus assembly protein CpaE